MRKYSFESAMDRIEQIVTELEVGNISLDASLSLYEEGTRLANMCKLQLVDAKTKVTVVNAENGGVFDVK